MNRSENHHWVDENGRPAGGASFGHAFTISWQNGPLGHGESRREPNGAFVKEIIRAAISRLEFYQSSEFACDANRNAILHLKSAIDVLEQRTRGRERRGVEGTHAQ